MNELVDRLKAIVGESHVLMAAAALDEYSHDGTFMQGAAVAVVLPASTDEVRAVVDACRTARMPVVPRGRGTSLVGGSVPVEPAVVLSVERLDQIEIDAGALVAVAGAGAITGLIQEAATQAGLMYPPDPASASMSSIGGNIACNAGGISCLKYGLTADYVLGLTVVLADGRVLTLGGRTRKRSSGYRLAQLFVGSEGTLGVITEVILKLIPLPRHHALAAVSFSSREAAGEAVTRLLSAGHLPAALEIMDREAVELVASAAPIGLDRVPEALLLVEQDGVDPERVLEDVLGMAELLDGDETRVAQSAAERERLWNVRKSFGKVLLSMPGNYFSEDIAVPVSAIPEMLRRITSLAKSSGLRIVTMGHAGDGNLHPCIVFAEDQRPLVGEAAARLFHDAVELGGTISAEHGLGALKRDHAVLEHQPVEIELWRTVKQQLDPEGLFNPHKVFPEGPPDGKFLERQPGWGSTRRGEVAV
ncbi:MAG TPA: FAD-linked oxidase C-terminal domain-containing protein [Candidatus Dormibacteraeota bacterium]